MRCHAIMVTLALLLANLPSFFAGAMFYVSPDTSKSTSRGYTNYSEERGRNVLTHTLEELIQKGVHPIDAFELQGLHTAGDDLLSTAALGVWMKYLEYFKSDNPTEEVSLLGMLLSHYGDDGVARIIETGIKKDSCEESAKLLQSELIQHWLKYVKTPADDEFQIRGRTPDEVFALLKLDKKDIFSLKNPLLNTWIKYVDAYNESKHQHFLLCEPLVNHLDEEDRIPESGKLMKMLMVAESAPNLKDIAIRMQNDLTQYLLSSREKYPPDEIFPLLGLDTLRSKLIENPRFLAWFKYAEDWHENYSVEVDTMAILEGYYSNIGLARMISVAKQKESTKIMAERLKILLFEHWKEEFGGEAYKTVYEDLELKKLKDLQFSELTFLVWIEFVFYDAGITNLSDRQLIESLKKVLVNEKKPELFSDIETNTWLFHVIMASSKNPESHQRCRSIMAEFLKELSQANTDLEIVAKILAADKDKRMYEMYLKIYHEKSEESVSKRPRTS